jgi:molybdate transport system ATP-binding protein
LRDEARLPMIYVTHSTEEISRLADQVIVLRNGQVAAQGTVFDLLSNLEFTALTGAPAYGAVIAARVAEHRAAVGLTILSFDGGELVLSRIDRPVGAALRVHLRAEDIMLACEKPVAISANNVLASTVAEIRIAGDCHADVLLRCGPVKFVSRITRASLVRLGIEPGQVLFAIVKSVTVDPQLGGLPQ